MKNLKCKIVADRSCKKVTHIQDQFNAVLHEGLVSQLANKERHNEEFFEILMQKHESIILLKNTKQKLHNSKNV